MWTSQGELNCNHFTVFKPVHLLPFEKSTLRLFLFCFFRLLVCSCGATSRRRSWGVESSTSTDWRSGWQTDSERKEPVRLPYHSICHTWLFAWNNWNYETFSVLFFFFFHPAIDALNFPPGSKGRREQPIKSFRASARYVGCYCRRIVFSTVLWASFSHLRVL